MPFIGEYGPGIPYDTEVDPSSTFYNLDQDPSVDMLPEDDIKHIMSIERQREWFECMTRGGRRDIDYARASFRSSYGYEPSV